MVDRKLYEKVTALARELRESSAKLDIQIREKYGTHYSDEDEDDIIDTLDYGYGVCSFERFEELMEAHKNGTIKDE